MQVVNINYSKSKEVFEVVFEDETKLLLNYNIFEKYRVSVDMYFSEDEILEMKQLGFTEKLILQFLAEKKNIRVSQQALNRFIRSRLQKMNLGAEKMVEKSQNDNKLINSKSPVSEPEKQKETLAQSNAGKNKFDWQKPINPDEFK